MHTLGAIWDTVSLDSVGKFALIAFGVWCCARVALAGYRFLRHAWSNLSRGRPIGEWLFEPVDFDGLPRRTLEHFDEFTPAMQKLAFERIRDYCLRRFPGRVFVRYFVAADGKTFGEISDYLGERAYGFFSLFDDGTYLETTATRSSHEPPQEGRLMLYTHPEASVAELYALHREHAVVHAEHTASVTIELTPENLDAAANYGRRLVHALFYRGCRPVEPPGFCRVTV
jgi:hypothetical protein